MTTRTAGYEQPSDSEWTEYPPGTVYRCPVSLLREADGGYSVIAATLPGVASQGDTAQDALANIREALAGAIQQYQADGVPIPWLEAPREPDDLRAVTRWVVVHVGREANR